MTGQRFIGMILVTQLLKRTVGEDNEKTEMFMTANRTVKTGLTASAVISVGSLIVRVIFVWMLTPEYSHGFGRQQC